MFNSDRDNLCTLALDAIERSKAHLEQCKHERDKLIQGRDMRQNLLNNAEKTIHQIKQQQLSIQKQLNQLANDF